MYITPQGLHFQIDSARYIRLDQNGLDLQNVSITPQYSNTTVGNNYIIADKSDTGSMQVFIGNPGFQYFYGTNQFVQISGSNFLLSRTGQLFISGVSGITPVQIPPHNQLVGLQGGLVQQNLQYYHLSQLQYISLLNLVGQVPQSLPVFTSFLLRSGSLTPANTIYLQHGQNFGTSVIFA